MRFILSLLTFFIVQSASGQSEEYFANLNPYLRYQDGAFECSFKSKNKEVVARCENAHYCSNFLTSSFLPDSTYTITLTLLQKTGPYPDIEYTFAGRYEIDDAHNILLKGDHPFSSATIKMKESKKKHYIYTNGYAFKLSSEFNWTNKGKLVTYCDGDCSIETTE